MFKSSYLSCLVGQSDIKKTILKLPIERDSDGNPVLDKTKKYNKEGYIPDWKFMEDYINSLPYSDKIPM